MAKKFPYALGWIQSQPDVRDLQYPVSPTPRLLPQKVDLTPLMPPVYDQKNIGSCGPQTLAALIEYRERKQGFSTPLTPSRLFLYYTTRQLMGTVNEDSGVTNRDLLKAYNRFGSCEEQEYWPYVTSKFKQKPPQSAFNDADKSKVESTKYVRVPQTEQAMCGAIADGNPIIFGFTVYNSIEEAARTGDIPYPSRRDTPMGGHDTLLIGYDMLARKYFGRNSWGVRWGLEGYFWIDFEYAHNPQLSNDFWTVLEVPSDEPSPGPGPGPTPIPDTGGFMDFFKKWILPILIELIKQLFSGDVKGAERTFLKLQDKVQANRDVLRADWSRIRKYLKLMWPWIQQMIEKWLNDEPVAAKAVFNKMKTATLKYCK